MSTTAKPRAPREATRTSHPDDLDSGHRTPALIFAGAADAGGAVTGDRVLTFERSVELGRIPKGDALGATWALPDPRVSGRHARLTRTDCGFEIVDLGSKNGTLVDGRRIEQPTPVRPGAIVLVGGTAAVLRLLTRDELADLLGEASAPFGPVPSGSPLFAGVLGKLKKLARTPGALLLSGETGVGKEVYARAVHAHSGRTGAMIALNCAAIPGELVESELFGYVKGAHSQACAAKAGLIERAEGGTLFLDEIADMPGPAQAKLLRFVQDRTYTPLGSTVQRRADVRILAASSRLDRGAVEGLRQDLRGRLGAEPITLPSLRTRPEDVGPLAAHFLGPHGAPALSVSAFLAVLMYAWPRNVRELESAMATAAALGTPGRPIELGHLPAGVRDSLQPSTAMAPVGPTSPRQESAPERRRSPRPSPAREELERLLAEHEGNVAHVARALDRQWAVVHRWIDRLGIDVARYRG